MSIFKEKSPEWTEEEILEIKSHPIYYRILKTVLKSIKDTKPNGDKKVKINHPCFDGSFDWHSCVHSFWSIVQILKNYEVDDNLKKEIEDLFEEHFTKEKIEIEIKNINLRWEFPYGFVWLLSFVSALKSEKYKCLLKPFEDEIRKIMIEKLLKDENYEIESEGQHFNTAFSLLLFYYYALNKDDKEIIDLIKIKSKKFYFDIPTFKKEKTKSCFLSNNLCILQLMSLTLEKKEFIQWAESKNWKMVFEYSPVSFDISKPFDCHDCGLNFSRCWNYYTLSKIFENEKDDLIKKAQEHYEKSINIIPLGNWIYDHYLGTFCLMAELSTKVDNIFS